MTMIKAVKPLTGEVTMTSLVKRLEKEEKNKSDIIVELSDIRVNQNMKFESDKTGEFALTEKAFRQLCKQLTTKYNVPYEYMMKVYEQDKEQFAHMMNWHFEKSNANKKQLRGITDEDGNLSVRGIVSETFSPFDNIKALEVFMNAMKRNGIDDYQIKTSSISDDFMFLRFILPSTMQSFGKTVDGKEDWNYMAMDLINGEIGNSTLKLISSAYRQICTNGMVALQQIDSLNKRHIGEQLNFESGMKVAIQQGFAIGDKTLKELALTKTILVDNPYETIEKYAKQAKLTETQAKVVRENYEIEAERNVMSIINAFTRTARDIKSIEKRVQMEQFASSIMEKELKRLV